MPLWLQVNLSFLLVVLVLWFMWRIPIREGAFFEWAPGLSLLSVWLGLCALGCSAAVWVVPRPDALIAALFMGVDPAAIGAGTLVLWIYRRCETGATTVGQQLLQAKVGITLGLLAVAGTYLYVFLHQPTPP